MKHIFPLCLALSGVIVLSSCQPSENVSYLTSNDPGTSTIKIYKDDSSTTKSRYISPKQVDLKFSYNDLSGTLSNNENVCPSIGDVNILVIPVHTPNSKFNTPEIRDDIEKVFFGSQDDTDLGYYSLSDYFYQSSFGKLRFKGKVTEWFDVATYTNIKSNNDITAGSNGTVISEILNKAVQWAIDTQDVNIKDYDQNKDGSIDAVWLVYDHYNYFNAYNIAFANGQTPAEEDINEVFWNYTSWDWSTQPNIDNPTTSAFSWASFDQMYSGYAEYSKFEFESADGTQYSLDIPDFTDLDNIPLDSHTFIHETGHLLGLEDYYASNNYRPAGSTSMMDQNIGDFDSYSKMLLGWVTPYVVYGSSEILLPTANSNDHSVIVIPSNYQEISDQVEAAINAGTIDEFRYEFNPFSEYIMIDLYSPDKLNYQDTFGPLLYERNQMMEATGARIYHVDSRIFQCRVVNYDGGQSLVYVDGYVWDEKPLEDDEAILMPISNERSESTSFQLPQSFDYFTQLRLIEATGINTFDVGTYASDSTLWTTKSESFDIYTFAYQFFNANFGFNDGNQLPFKIKCLTLKEIA